MHNTAKISVQKSVIPTYPEPPAEELPMFAENRVHQRTSGNPYPNKVVMQVDRSHTEDREYTVVTLENDYIKVEILPEIGGRIYSACDKLTGYDFFYKQHVIKPALIGVLGSWISGGVEFNWPFHHRASGFMPCDFTTEVCDDGTAICWLSEHDPLDRMKGMVGIVLRPDCSYLETRVKLYNRTDLPHSFLWWENAAVPVNRDYQIFFPQDVRYVNFHYLKSRITYPIAGGGVYNGIPMEEDRDISMHKNTVPATSYFASASNYDFFGGYDHGKGCGVVHIGDHHISPGKKMFTWGYGQLSKSWENALTDTDGQYAELMAGSYSDNQPNFSRLEPYETKQFSQYWYPISHVGTPTFANLNCALKIDREAKAFKIQSTKVYKNVTLRLQNGDKPYFETVCDLSPERCLTFSLTDIPAYLNITVCTESEILAEYRERCFDDYTMPDVITDMPSAKQIDSVDELYLAGVHVDQYRDPAVLPDVYWKEAIARDIHHIPSLIALAEFEYKRHDLAAAEGYILRAIRRLQLFNERTKSGEAYYIYGQILEAKGETDKAYDYYYKAAFAADSIAKAMTRISMIDLLRHDYAAALSHSNTALDYGRNNNLAIAVGIIAERALGHTDAANSRIKAQLAADPLDHTVRFLAEKADLYDKMDSDPVQTCLDIAFDLAHMGQYGLIVTLLDGLRRKMSAPNQPLLYTLGYYKYLAGQDGAAEYRLAESAPLGRAYPARGDEIAVLRDVIAKTASPTATMLLGCLYYSKRHYQTAADLWAQCDDYIAKRNLAVAEFSHLGRHDEALEIMKSLVDARPDDQQILYETVVLMDKMGVDPQQKIKLITAHTVTRDDLLTELSKAYNQSFLPDRALKTLLSHSFVPCEGGEHAIADQYMFAYLVKGRMAMQQGDTEAALAFFTEGQTLPQSLGAGIWNHCKLVPLKYHAALCLEKLGRTAEAQEIFRYIATITIEYFSNMHLKELPYYQALSLRHLGRNTQAVRLVTAYNRQWREIKNGFDNGYFGTTPFFISFMDEPARLRRAQYYYLTALCADLMHTGDAAKRIHQSASLHSDNLFALYFEHFGFPE